ncbi:hypothetical protein CSUI_005879, partial [Cystoisospora suis]
ALLPRRLLFLFYLSFLVGTGNFIHRCLTRVKRNLMGIFLTTQFFLEILNSLFSPVRSSIRRLLLLGRQEGLPFSFLSNPSLSPSVLFSP